MSLELIEVLRPEGYVEMYSLPAGASTSNFPEWKELGVKLCEGPNNTLFCGVDLIVKLLSGKIDALPGLNGMYIEFTNVPDPSAVVIPTVDLEKGVEYYRTLTGQRDYLRVPLHLYGNLTGSDPRYKANKAHYLGNSGGANGVNGLAFSAMAGSTVYGAALVHLGTTPADDIVYARQYMPTAKAVPADQQIGMSWVSILHHKDE